VGGPYKQQFDAAQLRGLLAGAGIDPAAIR